MKTPGEQILAALKQHDEMVLELWDMQTARELYDSGRDVDEVAWIMDETYGQVSEWLQITARPKDGC